MDKQLTKAEEQFMQVLWKLNEASVQNIIDQLPEPKPAYNTVSTIIRILETKNFVGHKAKGRGYLYFPLVKKEDYSNQTLNKLVDGYFEGSFKSMVSFFVKKNDVDINDLETILKNINDKTSEK
ncbi:MAG: BlaI/MecI/CopY family transcriptional regulator [Lutibacter sp.]|uniref:BlaI/MecI/CopY family transcriptional regulator n=1 Tax=Lutibacter sp. TaxID=1925666 RepID=UPI0018109B60|nr:BlaI/MecI/CopY family transcriptional regulator [Lutibacter sp.]MBT8317587.1 BlaI/MecI/CopY family transcriptional regulator [Lutibacter sp.]NNJ58446.1 BlaI/MecI/CopY family transcriptional regulator [Lutibacter sp.]